MEAQLGKELSEWLIFWGGSTAGILIIGTLCAMAHRWMVTP